MDLLEKATHLYEQGFAVIPTKADKSPIDSKWQDMVGDDRVVPNGNFQQSLVTGVGVVLGHWHGYGFLNVLDVDCYDSRISRELCSYIASKAGGEIAYRVGEKPKFAVPILLPEQHTKVTTDTFDGSRVELLAAGQQFVAYGAHPKAAGGYYKWYNGDLSADIPILTEQDLVDIFAYFEELCQRAGLTRETTGSAGNQGLEMDDLDVAIAAQPIDISHGEVKDLLEGYPAKDCSHDDWVKVGMALHHQYQGTEKGYKLWIKWSKFDQSRFKPSEMPTRWNSFGGRDNPVTMRTIIKKAARDKPRAKVMGFTRISDLEMKEPQWLVPGVLEEGAIAIWFGDPASYKTFIVVDIAMHVASGRDYHGKGVTRQGSVVYLAGEGHSGFSRRVNAWCKYHRVPITGLDFYKSDRAGTFEAGDTRKAMLAGIEAAFKDAAVREARLFVVDTLARNLGGDENASEAVNAMFDLLNRLQELYPLMTILIVAHPGHQNPNRPRGSAALLGNTDAYAKVKAVCDRVAKVQSFKMKDAEDFAPIHFNMHLEHLGITDDGEDYGSLVPVMMDEAPAPEPENDPVMIEKRRRWVTLDCFRDGHATRKTVQGALMDRSIPGHNTNHYGEYLQDLVKDEVLEEGPKDKQFKCTELGLRWLDNNSELIWS